jgi:hypothetical protein
MKYFYIENEEQKGPLTLEELNSVLITEKTLIWHEGLADWTEAKNIESFEHFFNKTTPPNIPTARKEPPKFEYQKQTPIQPTTVENKVKSKTKTISIVAGIIMLLIIGIYFITKNDNSEQGFYTNPETTNNNQPVSYSNGSNENAQTNFQEQNTSHNQQNTQQQEPRKLSEEEIRANLYNKEISNPASYLTTSATYRVNLAANTIIEGSIYNSASIAGFKNIKLTAKFYSKTDVLLGKESFLVMDFISPNGSLSFKNKIIGWWDNIDHWTLSVNSAEVY